MTTKVTKNDRTKESGDPGMVRIQRPKEFRPAIPPKVKFDVLIRQEGKCACGCGEKLGNMDNVQFDHDPALVNRDWNEWDGDTIPPANDPAYLFAKTIVHHKTKTKKDIKTRDKTRRVTKATAEHKKKMSAKAGGIPDPEVPPPKPTWPSGSGSRGFFGNSGSDEAADVSKIQRTASSSLSRGPKLQTNRDGRYYRAADGSTKLRADRPRPTDPPKPKF